MINYRISATAKSDIFAICKFIADDNIKSAHNLKEHFIKSFRFLGENPHSGSKKFGINTLRFHVVRKNYLIVYNFDAKPIDIVRVFHTSRDIPKLLQKYLKPK